MPGTWESARRGWGAQGLEENRAGGHLANDIQRALSDLAPALRLLGRLATQGPDVVLEIVHDTAVRDGGGGDAPDVSLGTLVAQAVSVLEQLPSPPVSLLGECAGRMLDSASARCSLRAECSAVLDQRWLLSRTRLVVLVPLG